ncbi:MAG: XrtA/PEP-CTERM system exopolysaccharide export protein [Candidatus Competibacterales bacterium]
MGLISALAGCALLEPDLPELPPHRDFGPGDALLEDIDPRVASYNYRIGPGDALTVFVWRNPEVSADVTVRPDGKITTPLVEDLQAAGKTPAQLATDIEEVLATYIRQPDVTVITSGFSGTYQEQVRVVGQATEPQAIPYSQNMSLLDVMIRVGGLTEFAAGNRAKLVRQVDGEAQEYRVRLADLLQDGDVSANVSVQPGDVLIIPETVF